MGQYVQGTQVRLDLDVTDTDTGRRTDPDTLVCRVQNPTGEITEQDLAVLVRLSIGRYRAIVDTSPCPHAWFYQWIANDELENAVRGSFDVTPAIPALV